MVSSCVGVVLELCWSCVGGVTGARGLRAGGIEWAGGCPLLPVGVVNRIQESWDAGTFFWKGHKKVEKFKNLQGTLSQRISISKSLFNLVKG